MALWKDDPRPIVLKELRYSLDLFTLLLLALQDPRPQAVKLESPNMPDGLYLEATSTTWTIAGQPLQHGTYQVVLKATSLIDPELPSESKLWDLTVNPFNETFSLSEVKIGNKQYLGENSFYSDPITDEVSFVGNLKGPVFPEESAKKVETFWIKTKSENKPTIGQITNGLDAEDNPAIFFGTGHILPGTNIVKALTPNIPKGSPKETIWITAGYNGSFTDVIGGTFQRVPTEKQSKSPYYLPRYARQHNPENILVAYIQGDEEGERTALEYLKVRRIPSENLFGCPQPLSWDKYTQTLGSGAKKVLEDFKNKIDQLESTGLKIKGIQLCGDWPIDVSFWRFPLGSNDYRIIPFIPLLMIHRLVLKYIPDGTDLAKPSSDPTNGLVSGYWNNNNINSSFLDDFERWDLGKGKDQDVLALDYEEYTLPPKEKTEVYSVASIPCFDRPADKHAIPLIHRSATSEGRYKDFGNVLLTDTDSSVPLVQYFLNEAEKNRYPLDSVFYRSRNPTNSRLFENDLSYHQVPGSEGYKLAPDIGVFAIGNLGEDSSSYWRTNVNLPSNQEQVLRPGAIATYSQSFPLRTTNALALQWDKVVKFGDNKIASGTSRPETSDSIRLVSEMSPGYNGSFWRLYLWTTKSVDTAQVETRNNYELVLKENGVEVFTINVRDKELVDWFEPLRLWLRSNGWSFDWGRSSGPSCRGLDAIQAGACLTWGSAQEPLAGNDGYPERVIGCFKETVMNFSEYIYHKYYIRGFPRLTSENFTTNQTHNFYGDLLYRPFTDLKEGPRIMANLNITFSIQDVDGDITATWIDQTMSPPDGEGSLNSGDPNIGDVTIRAIIDGDDRAAYPTLAFSSDLFTQDTTTAEAMQIIQDNVASILIEGVLIDFKDLVEEDFGTGPPSTVFTFLVHLKQVTEQLIDTEGPYDILIEGVPSPTIYGEYFTPHFVIPAIKELRDNPTN